MISEVTEKFFDDLGLCKCSDADAVTEFVKDVLTKCKDGKHEELNNPATKFALYVLDRFDYLQHGVSIDWAWLTKKGEELLNEKSGQIDQNGNGYKPHFDDPGEEGDLGEDGEGDSGGYIVEF